MFCNVPTTSAFMANNGKFRNCCATYPSLRSDGSNFDEWWYNNKSFNEFREVVRTKFHQTCESCARDEEIGVSSLRVIFNKDREVHTATLPSYWSVRFGNVCNLACWSCDENSSSTIAAHKRVINILPDSYHSPAEDFQNSWDKVKYQLLQSYDQHDIIYLSALGGEPTVSVAFFEFAQTLIQTGLSKRTVLEITTNCSKINKYSILMLDKSLWREVRVFASIDAIGKVSEWIRYGSNWNDVTNNLEFYKKYASYLEIHTVITMLNITFLPELMLYMQSEQIPVKLISSVYPEFMDITKWDKGKDFLREKDFEQAGIYNVWQSVGARSSAGSADQLANFIHKFDSIRLPLRDFSHSLAGILLGEK